MSRVTHRFRRRKQAGDRSQGLWLGCNERFADHTITPVTPTFGVTG